METDADGNDLTIVAWVKQTANSSKHLFKSSTGTGAGGDQHRGRAGGFDEQNNPWMPDKWDLTKQGRIMKEDPQKAERLAAAAGHMIGTVRFKKTTPTIVRRSA